MLFRSGSGSVGAADLGLLIAAWGPITKKTGSEADLDGSGAVDGADLGRLIERWASAG